MPDSQALYDIEFVQGEFGDNYDIVIKEDDGSLSDISWATRAYMDIKKLDGTVVVSIPTTDFTIISASSKARWAMKSGQTTGYTGFHKAYLVLEDAVSPTRRKKPVELTVFVHE